MKTNTSPQTQAAHDAPANNIIQLNLAAPKTGSRNLPLPVGDGRGEGQTRNLALPVPKTLHSKLLTRNSRRRHQVARSRAAWWFGQMRKVVNAAVEWNPAPTARPEQTYITLEARR